MKKLVSFLPFVALFLLPLLFYPCVDASGWRSNSDVHALLEFASSLLTITAGIMVLLHFFTTGRSFFLIISIGFVLIGTEEFVHGIFSFNRIWFEIPPTFKLAISTTWLSGHFVFLISFFIALIFGKRVIVPAKRRLYAAASNIIGLICAASVSLLIFNFTSLPDFFQLGSIAKKLIELSLAFLFFVAFALYSNIYLKQQSRSPLLWSIIACIIFMGLAHIFVFDAQFFYDSHWDTAHLLVFLSSFFLIFGVWGETIKIHRSAQVQVIELAKEITKRKQTEEELRESEDRFKVIASRTPDHILVQDNELLYTLVINPQLGLTEQDMLGKTDYDFLSKEEADKLTGIKRQVIEAGEPRHIETSLISKDGKPEFFDGTYIPKFDAHGKADGLIGYFRNVTERKQAEASLKKALEWKEAIFEGSRDAIFISDQDSRFVAVNSAACDLTGYLRKQLLKMRIPDIHDLPDLDAYRMYHQRIFNGEEILSEAKILRSDGAKIDTEFNNRCESIAGKLYMHTTARDITGRKQVEEALKINEALFRGFYDNMKSGSAIFTVINDGSKGSDYIIKKFNRSGLKIEGKTLEEIVGKRLIDLRPTIDSYGLIPVMKKVWETGESASLPTRIYIDDRYSNYYENYVFKLPSGEVVTLYDDVTESKRAKEILQLEKENFRHSLDDSPLGVRIATVEGNTIYTNKTLLNFYGYDSLGELQKTPLKDRYTPESYRQSQQRKQQRERGDLSTIDYEISIIRKNGEILHLKVFRKEVLWDGVSQFQIIYDDITERKKAEETIRILARFPSENPDPVLRVDRNGQLLYANEASYKLLTWKLQIGEKAPLVLQKIIAEALKGGIEKIIETEHKQQIISFNVVPVVVAGYANFYGHDITLRKQTDEDIRKSKKILEDLYKHLNETRENERALISREIHDQLGQSMTALKLDLNMMQKYVSANPEAVTKLESMIELVSNTIKDVQRISSDLRPGILDELGLVSAIEWYCEEFEKRTGIKCNLKLNNQDFNDSQINLTLFRVLQETLTNVIRHAKASSVSIKLHQLNKGTIMTIKDNGIGITMEQIESNNSLGLINMRERVRQFNGTIDILSNKGGGTKLTIFIPS